MILTVLDNVSSVVTSFVILSTPCFTVEWSFPPRKMPIDLSGVSVMERMRYIAICLGLEISAFLLLLFRSAIDTPKCSETISSISSGVTSLLFLEDMISFSASEASVISICVALLFSLYRAISLLSEPSSSRMLVLIFFQFVQFDLFLEDRHSCLIIRS